MAEATQADVLESVLRGALATGARTPQAISAAILAAGFRWSPPSANQAAVVTPTPDAPPAITYERAESEPIYGSIA